MLILPFPIPLLTALAVWCGQAACCLSSDHGCRPAGPSGGVICITAAHGASGKCVAYGVGGPPGRTTVVRVGRDEPAGQAKEKSAAEVAVRKASSKWIGVTLSPVPAPLAAHIGGEGLMITNIAKDSPADKAGLERYDVILEFDRRKVQSMEDLVDAIAATATDTSVEMTIVRGGSRSTVKIAPAERPEGDWEYKYEEPEEQVVDRMLKLRGHRLRPGPGGGWIFEELGPLQKLPDVFKELEKFDTDDWPLRIGPDDEFDLPFWPEELRWSDEDGRKVEAHVEVRVQVDDDGKVTTIWRDRDGQIHVQRVDPDGRESRQTYPNAEEFKKQDPEAYKLYDRFSRGGRPHGWTFLRPPAGDLGKLQKRFQVEVETKLRDALERAKEAQQRAEEEFQKARERLQEPGRDKVEAPARQDLGFRVASIKIDDDGTITVTTRQNGRRTTYVFDSKEEFQQKEPQLFEQVKSFFE